MVRIVSLAALAVAVWLLGAHGQSRPDALGLGAPAAQFSAARASAALGRVLGPERPHPVGSPENAAVRARLLAELKAMGVQAREVRSMSCYSEARWRAVECGTVTNIIAGVTPGSGKVVLLMAHLDSVAAGPGACDDGCGVATLLETIRALKAGGANGAHPIVALFTDGEEAGLSGAAAYLRDPLAKAKTGVVINVEARGNSGPSYLFQTSDGNARLIDLYARSVPRFATSSLYGEIYKFLPNDTDLTPFLHAGIPGYNFALVGQVAQYHTALDRRANIDLRGLQQHGDNALALAQTLSNADLANLKSSNAIYLDILGRWLPRMAVAWALPLSILAFMLIALAGFFTRRERREIRRPWLGLLMPPLFLVGAVGIGFGLHWIAVAISGHDQPAFAHPLWLRLSLGFGVFAMALLTARGAGAVASWLWLSGLAIACAVLAPGVTPYFLFPALVAAPLLLATVRGGRGVAVFVSALAGSVIWLSLCAGTEPLMGIDVHPIFTVTAAFGLMTLLPLLKTKQGWGISLGVSLAAALVLAVVAGFQPAYNASAPRQLNLAYLDHAWDQFWIAEGAPSAALRQAVTVSPYGLPKKTDFVPFAGPSWMWGTYGQIARADAVTLPPFDPRTMQLSPGELRIEPHGQGDALMLAVPAAAGVTGIAVGDARLAAPHGNVLLICATPDCLQTPITLTGALKASANYTLTMTQMHRGLPPGSARMLAARAPAIGSGRGDVTLQSRSVTFLNRGSMSLQQPPPH